MSEHMIEPWPPYGPFLGLPMTEDGCVLISAADYRRAQQCVNACAVMKAPMEEVRALKKDSDYLVTSERMRAEVIQQRDELVELAKQARKELVTFAEELKVSSTIDGDWGEEWEAKEEYDRLMALAAKLAEKEQATL